MVIFKECKHFFKIVQALFPKSASTLVFYVHKWDCPFCVQKALISHTLYNADRVGLSLYLDVLLHLARSWVGDDDVGLSVSVW